MGRCITIITLTGATSLGLLTGSLAYQSVQKIPDLIRQLNTQESLKAPSATPILAAIRTNLSVSNAVNAVLAAFSTWLFTTAYKYSPAAGKHPFLIYAALGAPLTLAAFYYQTGTKACGFTGPFGGNSDIEQLLRAKVAQVSQKYHEFMAKETQTKEPPTVAEDELLDQSYIHVSDETLSGESAPETPITATASESSTIEDEVEAALSKKERVKDLETIASAYNVASVIAGVSFVICSIGVIGDQFFL